MFLKGLWFIYKNIRAITSVIPTLAPKSFIKIKLLFEDAAHPSEGRGWGMEQLQSLKIKTLLMRSLKSTSLLNAQGKYALKSGAI